MKRLTEGEELLLRVTVRIEEGSDHMQLFEEEIRDVLARELDARQDAITLLDELAWENGHDAKQIDI